MKKKCFLKAAVFLLVFAGIAEGAFAQVTISGGFALSSMSAKLSGDLGSGSVDGEIGAGGNIYADYLLPIGIPLSLGFEVGVDTASVKVEGFKANGTVVPLLLRAAYHFDLMPKLDLYAVGKIGVAVGSVKFDGNTEDGFVGVGFGFDVGAAYYFIPRFGIFVEAGFDRYNLEKEFSVSDVKGKLATPFNRFVTIGVSTKF